MVFFRHTGVGAIVGPDKLRIDKVNEGIGARSTNDILYRDFDCGISCLEIQLTLISSQNAEHSGRGDRQDADYDQERPVNDNGARARTSLLLSVPGPPCFSSCNSPLCGGFKLLHGHLFGFD